MVVITGILIQSAFQSPGSRYSLDASQMVNLPIAKDFASFAGFFTFPK